MKLLNFAAGDLVVLSTAVKVIYPVTQALMPLRVEVSFIPAEEVPEPFDFYNCLSTALNGQRFTMYSAAEFVYDKLKAEIRPLALKVAVSLLDAAVPVSLSVEIGSIAPSPCKCSDDSAAKPADDSVRGPGKPSAPDDRDMRQGEREGGARRGRPSAGGGTGARAEQPERTSGDPVPPPSSPSTSGPGGGNLL